MNATNQTAARIDYRDNLWLVSAPGLGAEIGFRSLLAATSFAGSNLPQGILLTNKAIVEKTKSGV